MSPIIMLDVYYGCGWLYVTEALGCKMAGGSSAPAFDIVISVFHSFYFCNNWWARLEKSFHLNEKLSLNEAEDVW